MPTIYLGPAGVPTVSEDRSTIGGIRCVAELGLNALECEFVRRVSLDNEAARRAGEEARRLGVRLSVHCPYFINLCSPDKEKLEASKVRILESAERAHHMGADVALFHPGFYGRLSPDEAYRAVRDACTDIVDRMNEMGIADVKLGLETTGKQSTFGTPDEVIDISGDVKGCVPIMDFAHIYARNAGRINYGEIFDALKQLKLKHLHTHFTGVEFSVKDGKGNERRHLTLSSDSPPFEPLAAEILNRGLDITIICESPILEQDSLLMKRVFEKMGYEFEHPSR